MFCNQKNTSTISLWPCFHIFREQKIIILMLLFKKKLYFWKDKLLNKK